MAAVVPERNAAPAAADCDEIIAVPAECCKEWIRESEWAKLRIAAQGRLRQKSWRVDSPTGLNHEFRHGTNQSGHQERKLI
jgi:hypothetical protein